MILNPTACGWLLFLCITAVSASADLVGDYKVILERNPFGLKPTPPPPKIETIAPPGTPLNYKLTGMTALFKKPRAMFVNQIPGKTTPEYISLSEGQRQNGLEVLPGGIDLSKGTVRVKISGEERTLSFAKDGLSAVGASAPSQPMAVTTLPQPTVTPLQASKLVAPNGVGGPSSILGPSISPPLQPTPSMMSPGYAGGRPIGVLQSPTSPSPGPNSNPTEQIEIMRRQAYSQRNTQMSSQPTPPTPQLPPTDPKKR